MTGPHPTILAGEAKLVVAHVLGEARVDRGVEREDDQGRLEADAEPLKVDDPGRVFAGLGGRVDRRRRGNDRDRADVGH